MAKISFNLLVVELKGLEGRNPKKPHLYVSVTSRNPGTEFERLVKGEGPQFVRGKIVKLRNDLIPNYKETTKREVAGKRLEKLKTDLSRLGYGINMDSKKWVVYVLNVDADVKPIYPNRGELGKVVYVGQTSVTREKRLAQHQGRELSKSGKYIGSPKVRGRNPTINKGLTPSKILFTEDDAKAFETKIHRKLETLGYRVLGDVSDKSA
jgi:hypothetical protein